MSQFNWPVIGHKKIVNYLQSVVANQKLNHAYLFYGPDFLGKRLVADYFMQSIFCIGQVRPCKECVHCQQINNRVHPDVIYIARPEDKSNISVEQARQVKSKLQNATFLNSYKIVLINGAQELSLAAANALLKILEEPTSKTIFILISNNISNIPQTILSRVQLIKFQPVGKEELSQYLKNKGQSRDEIYKLTHFSAGYPGKLVYFEKHPKLLSELEAQIKQIYQFINQPLYQKFNYIQGVAAQSKSAKTKEQSQFFIQILRQLLRDMLLIKNMCFGYLINTQLKGQLTQSAQHFSSPNLVSLIKKCDQAERYIQANANPRLSLEELALTIKPD